MIEDNQLVKMNEFKHYDDCWKQLEAFINSEMFVHDSYSELIIYGIATAGITSTIHHCGTFLRQIINRKPVVLYLDAAKT